MEYHKPYKSFEEQVLWAQTQHGLIVENMEKAIHIFKTFSYYDLINGYIKSLASDLKKKDSFNSVTLDYLLDLFMCDREIQGTLFTHSVHCETKFKNIMANVIAEKYSVDHEEYLKLNHYKQSHIHINPEKLITRISNNYKTEKEKGNLEPWEKDKDYVENPTKHYRDRHNHIPPWILFKNTTFNDIIDLYQVLFGSDKTDVVDNMFHHRVLKGTEIQEHLLTSITGVRQFRNVIAHNKKFISHQVKRRVKVRHLEKSRAGSLGIWKMEDKNFPERTQGALFYICSILNILDNDVAVRYFIISMLQVLSFCEVKYRIGILELYYRVSSLPPDLKERLTNALIMINASQHSHN